MEAVPVQFGLLQPAIAGRHFLGGDGAAGRGWSRTRSRLRM